MKKMKKFCLPALVLVHVLVLVLASSCGYSYEKKSKGVVQNDSDYFLDVALTEGCYSGKTHRFAVAPKTHRDYKYTYTCNDHDEESDRLAVSYRDYNALGYKYFSIPFTTFSNQNVSVGLEISYAEDDAFYSYVLKTTDIDQNEGVGSVLQTSSSVQIYRGELRIKPASPEVLTSFFGIAIGIASPFVPASAQSFEKNGMIFHPMVERRYENKPGYSGKSTGLVCDNYRCR